MIDPEREGGGEAAEIASRVLCPDGSCLGVIGPDGRCKVCGAVSSEPPPAASEEDDAPRGAADDSPELADAASLEEGVSDDDLASRDLCPDGSCIGVIGPDGRCKVCGAPAAAS